MPTITAIKPQKNGKRVNIYLDGKFGFGIDLKNFTRLGLRVKMELSDKEVEKIVKKAQFQKNLDYLLKFATLRPRSEKEIEDWFKRKKVHESIHKELFNRLKRLDLINDKEFAKWWIEQRIQFKSKSKRDLNHELRIKGIKQEIINEVLGRAEIDEEKMAEELLAKKAYKWLALPRREKGQKMSHYLAGKGFEWEIIERVVKKQLK